MPPRQGDGKKLEDCNQTASTIEKMPYNQVEQLQVHISHLQGKINLQEKELLDLYRILHGNR